ncbi:YIP1 family protein [Hafnia paralvei]|nr:YIP1 family protein [Hafnia paralvei]
MLINVYPASDVRGCVMSNHVWGLLSHPAQEFRQIQQENESVSHIYTHHVLLMAAIPVVCSFIGTTQFGWDFGGDRVFKVLPMTALAIAVVFYGLMLAAVGFVGMVIRWMAREYENCPSLNRCIVFAGYVGTPMFLSSIVSIYPMVWLCMLAVIVGVCYSGYLLYRGIPNFLGITEDQGFIFSGSTFAIGVLVLELLLGITVIMWGYGSHIF